MAPKENIVVFPFMAQGHIIPFLSLALKLEQEKGYEITFVNTPLNIKKLQDYIPKFSNIRLVEIPFDRTEHGLPPNSESTETLPLPLMLRFIESSPLLKPAFTNLVSRLIEEDNGRLPLCIISDMFFAWSAEVAHEFGIFHAIFNAGAGYGMAVFHTIWLNLPQLKSNSEEFSLPGFPRGYRFKTKNLPVHLRECDGPWEFANGMFKDWLKTHAMLFNTIEDIDNTGLTYFREQFPNCSVYSIGPILSSAGSKARGGEEAVATMKHCMKWLDKKATNSVLYVAFGSQSSPSEAQTKELAKALEASNVDFLWVFRPPSSFVTDSECTNKDWLPEGFEERIKNSKRGLLLKKWAPQMEILSHKSVGAFLSHCGWNSCIEALSNGVPMLAWPMGAEQPFNAHMLEEELGVCVGVANGHNHVEHEEIMEKIELVMEEGREGDLMRRKALKVMEMIKRGSKGASMEAMDDFLIAAHTACI
ncbi:UDP-glycosyltransferase 92A1-like [Olea europaea var. sylvestris]|uniref:UDP-glycosyltransferase 92A1-like n=1 Tax=Olea europaea var. sylvestris TaxID=158386 RepID=UPI000C1D6C85|nr:UDP-glycosyltransferase 92A1-like [Olea europaea var. sylvestris]